jgi:hypothetical protein
MNREIYPDISTQTFDKYFFTSIGRHGYILKAVIYTPVEFPDTYNLGMATVKYDEFGKAYLDGEDRTNNGDINLVLSTTAKTIEIYTTIYPERKVYFQGYEPHLTKIYHRAIRNDLESIIELYNVYGDKDERVNHYKFESFSLTEDYYGFLLERK